MDIIVSWAEIKITYLVSWLTITTIVSNSEDNRSFLIKSIEIEFHDHSGMESCLRDL